jgi:hypothetical protein
MRGPARLVCGVQGSLRKPVVFLLVSGVFAPQGGGGIDIKLP